MSKAEKRVAIAKDVIAQIKMERYIPESGTYVSINTTDKAENKNLIMETLMDKPADQMSDEGMIQCTVCAKGAMFMSHIRKDSNSCTVGGARDGQDEQDIEDRVTDVFSEEQLDLIESAFESDASFYSDSDHEESFDNDGDVIPGTLGGKAENFGQRYNTDQKRLMAIIRNIIRNKGTFVLK